jgi:hypothetical protein
MSQIVDAVVGTLTRFIDTSGPKVVIGALVLVGAGIVLKVIHRVLSGRGPDEG